MVRVDSAEISRHVGAANRTRQLASRGALTLGWLGAAVLIIGIVAIVLNLTSQHALLGWSIRLADVIDLGVFDRRTGIFDIRGEHRRELGALANWGFGAFAYAIVGLTAARLLRP